MVFVCGGVGERGCWGGGKLGMDVERQHTSAVRCKLIRPRTNGAAPHALRLSRAQAEGRGWSRRSRSRRKQRWTAAARAASPTAAAAAAGSPRPDRTPRRRTHARSRMGFARGTDARVDRGGIGAVAFDFDRAARPRPRHDHDPRRNAPLPRPWYSCCWTLRLHRA